MRGTTQVGMRGVRARAMRCQTLPLKRNQLVRQPCMWIVNGTYAAGGRATNPTGCLTGVDASALVVAGHQASRAVGAQSSLAARREQAVAAADAQAGHAVDPLARRASRSCGRKGHANALQAGVSRAY